MIAGGLTNGLTRRANCWRDILGVPVAVMNLAEASQFLEGRIHSRTHTPVAFLNANNANIASDNPELKRAFGHFVTLADGVGVDIASRVLHGSMFPENLNGTDLVPALLRNAAKPLKIGLIGAQRAVAEQALAAFSGLFPQHSFTLYADGFFKIEDEAAILAHLAADRPDILLVAMGVPRQELWIESRITAAHCTVPIAVGALFDLFTGSIPRAPAWMIRWRAEWLYRLWREPKRLWRRYLVGNPKFILAVLRAYLAGTSSGRGMPSSAGDTLADGIPSR